MKRSSLNLFIDVLAFIGLILLLGSGLLIRYILPPGSGKSLAIWSLTRHEWGEVHFWIAAFLIAVVTVHLVLHWRWIISVLENKPREGSGMRFAFGVIGLITVLIIVAAPFLSLKEKIPSVGNENETRTKSHVNKGRQNPLTEKIRGSMTFDDVRHLTGVPVMYILRALALPENTPPDQKLGQIVRRYGLEIEDVRAVVGKYGTKKPE